MTSHFQDIQPGAKHKQHSTEAGELSGLGNQKDKARETTATENTLGQARAKETRGSPQILYTHLFD